MIELNKENTLPADNAVPTKDGGTENTPTTHRLPANKAHCASDTEDFPHLKAPEQKTKGEKWFDKIVYTGIGYFANLGLSVVIADAFLHGKGSLNRFFVDFRSKTNSALSKVMSEKAAKEWSDIASKTATLPVGGHVVMVPIKLLEDRKKRITYWINSNFFPEEYKNQGIAIKPVSQLADDELPEVVECPPKASWLATAKRRMLSWGAVIATNSILDRGVKIGDKSFNQFVEDNASKMTGLQKGSKLDNYVRLTATDSYLTVITAFITRITNGSYFKKKRPSGDLTPLTDTQFTAEPALVEKTVAPHENTVKKIIEMGPSASHSQRALSDMQTGAPSL